VYYLFREASEAKPGIASAVVADHNSSIRICWRGIINTAIEFPGRYIDLKGISKERRS
jgi:hypothetical protein